MESVLTNRSSPPLVLLPGMTAEYPVFSRLAPLLTNASTLSFLRPNTAESLSEYARRMAAGVPRDAYLIGVSFGGILAQEMARHLRPAGCIIVASIRGPEELPPWFRLGRTLGGSRSVRLLRCCGECASLVPRRFRSGSTMRASRLAGAAGAWHRWAISAVLDWKPQSGQPGSPLLQIHGDRDTTFPLHFVSPDVVVAGGRHALPISHPEQVAEAIHRFIRRNELDHE